MKKILISGMIIAAGFFGIMGDSETASAASKDTRPSVIWDDARLVEGQIGKVTILKDTSRLIKESNGSFKPSGTFKKGNTYRVYSYEKINGVYFYGVGAGVYVKNSSDVFYKTPSALKKRQMADLVMIKSDLLADAANGKLKGQDFIINRNTIDDVKSKLGEPYDEGLFEGSRYYQYGKKYVYFTVLPDGKEILSSKYLVDSVTDISPLYVKNRLGSESIYREEYSEKDGTWNLVYKTGSNLIYFVFNGPEGKERLIYIHLMQQK
ncbi:DUF4309 domain-containing protein [Bacillus sp. NTK034]|uniref:DUF4309 domain-containing protein n=1 Tax=Bacillus sp. NTK034 TaxID=2802176 RepID=UPI001A900D44|nr:DUF4309 domain-containing protein [Bacillus sp. NTK034]MBN8201498.1 DUF4309 domain-containing protein [Bacillus sp. NTK034]